MYPTLIRFDGLSIHTYGVFIALGFLAGIWVATREARRADVDPETVLDLAFYVIAAAIIGSRLFYVAVNWEMFRDQPLDILKIWRGGLVFYGGLAAAVPTVVLYVFRQGLHPWLMGDVLAPALALGQSFGRLGCFFAGCCYGRLAGPWPSVVFTHPESLAPQGLPLHPTQLYDSALMLVIFAILMVSNRRWRSFEGQTFWTYLLLFTPERIFLEELRADTQKTLFAGTVSLTQLISAALFLLAALMLVRGLMARRRRLA